MEISVLGCILIMLGAVICPIFTLGVVMCVIGHPIMGGIIIVISLLDKIGGK